MAKARLSDQILEDLKSRILTGELKVGDKLPPERVIAEQYSVSRIPVREAIKKLIEAGAVRTIPGAGTIVLSQGSTLEAMPSVGFEMKDNNVLLYETLKLRKLIEAEAARKAALNRTSEDIKEIQAALFDSINEIRKLKAKESNTFFDADYSFHRSILKASHDEFLEKCIAAIPNTIATHQFWSLKFTTPRDEVVSYHTQIYESILDGNGEKAYEAMNHHLERVELLIRSGDGDDTAADNHIDI